MAIRSHVINVTFFLNLITETNQTIEVLLITKSSVPHETYKDISTQIQCLHGQITQFRLAIAELRTQD